jgi:hypothetical protein
MRLKIRFLGLVLAMAAVSPLSARECKYGELADQDGQKVTMTATIAAVEPEEDDPKAVFITLDNSTADHCFAFISGLPKSSLGNCKAGKAVTATGKVYARMEAWWGLQKVTEITCK